MRKTMWTNETVETFGIIVLLALTPLTMALGTPMLSPDMVKYSSDEATNVATDTMKAKIPNTISVKYTNPLKHLFLMGAFATIIYVGHGEEEGIKTHNGVLPWPEFKASVSHTPANLQYIVACNSHQQADAISHTTGKRVLGFKGNVDAKVAALAIVRSIFLAYGHIKVANQLVSEIIETVFDKLLGNKKLLPLFWMSGRVFYTLWVIPYRHQIWWKFTESEADHLIYDLNQGGYYAAIAAIVAGLGGGGLAAALTALFSTWGFLLASAFSTAQSHSDGLLVYFLDVWAGYGMFKTKWLNDGSIHTILNPILYDFLGTLRAVAASLPKDWAWAGTYTGVF